ncbi:MAG: hypothetical protein J6S73_09650, partial [Lentisphaeria bacterium]|nr:hypothetical protein [Lentisphaeria bacterium]
KKEKRTQKGLKREEGVQGGREKTFLKSFSLPPARRIAEQGKAMQSPEQILSFKYCHAQGLCEAGFSALNAAEPGWRKKSPVNRLIFLWRRVPPPPS